jgi:Tol biopolymer transport system component
MRKLILVAVAGALVVAAQQKQTAAVQLQSAINREIVAGDLKGAIEQYKKIVAANRGDHAIAARALVQLGQCYEKLGDAEARKAYDQVLRDYPDQKELADTARMRMAKLRGAGPVPQPATRLLWASKKADEGSISPDGRYLSYTDWETGNLTVHDFVTGADRVMTTAGSWKSGAEAYADSSAISIDGKYIVYSWWDERVDEKLGRSELRVAAFDDLANPRRLAQAADIEPTAWSPDGKWIAASVQRANPAPSRSDHTRQICLINAQDGSIRVLKSASRYSMTHGFSPDGKYLLYVERTFDGINSSSRAYILSLDGKSDVPLSARPASFQTSPVWTPDGTRIVFGIAPPGAAAGAGASGLWFVRVADGKPLGEPEPLKADAGNSFPVGFSREGSLFFSVRASSPSDIYLANMDPATGKLTSEAKRVNQHAIGTSWGSIAWLPDSKSVSFWSRRDGRDAVVVHTLETAAERELWTHDVGGGLARVGWFPDGRIMTVEASGQNEVFRRVNGETGEVLATWTIPAPSPQRGPRWISPELMTAFFARKDESAPCKGNTCTWAMVARNIETGRDREICRLDAINVTVPVASPNGRDVAFIARASGNPQNGARRQSLMIAPSAGGASRELYSPDAGFPLANAIAWTRDGSRVLTFWVKEGEEAVWSFPAKGGPPEKSPLHLPIGGSGSAAVSPDGTRLAFVGAIPRGGEIWVMPGLSPPAKTTVLR